MSAGERWGFSAPTGRYYGDPHAGAHCGLEGSARWRPLQIVSFVVALTAGVVGACFLFLCHTPAASFLLGLPANKATSLYVVPLLQSRLSVTQTLPGMPTRRPPLLSPLRGGRLPKEEPVPGDSDPDFVYTLPQPAAQNALLQGAVLGAIGASTVELAATAAVAAEVAMEGVVTAEVAAASGAMAGEIAGMTAAAAGGAVGATAGAVTFGSTATSLIGGYMLAFGTGSLRLDMMAGLVAVVLSTLVTHPIDTMKSRIQAGKNPIGSQGFAGLYHGLVYSFIKKCPETSIYIAIYHGIREALLHRTLNDARLLTDVFLKCLIVSSIAGSIAASILKVPFEIINRQLQVGSVSCGRAMFRTLLSNARGRLFLFVSWVTVLLRDIPKPAFQFGLMYVFALLGHGFMAQHGVPIFFQQMFYAAVGGGVAAFLTTPLDVFSLKVMTRLDKKMQAVLSDAQFEVTETGAVRRVSPGPLREALKSIVTEMWQDGGLGGLYRGALLRTLTYVPGSCIFYSVFETLVAAAGGH